MHLILKCPSPAKRWDTGAVVGEKRLVLMHAQSEGLVRQGTAGGLPRTLGKVLFRMDRSGSHWGEATISVHAERSRPGTRHGGE